MKRGERGTAPDPTTGIASPAPCARRYRIVTLGLCENHDEAFDLVDLDVECLRRHLAIRLSREAACHASGVCFRDGCSDGPKSEMGVSFWIGDFAASAPSEPTFWLVAVCAPTATVRFSMGAWDEGRIAEAASLLFNLLAPDTAGGRDDVPPP